MIKQTLCFSNPAYLSVTKNQLVIKTGDISTTRPIEDIGVVVLDNSQITITQNAMALLLENNVALITCNAKHIPTGMFLEGNSLQSNRFQTQIAASEPLKKNLWQQTVQAKILNQASVLKLQGKDIKRLEYLAKTVSSGDSTNCEAQAANFFLARRTENFPTIY